MPFLQDIISIFFELAFVTCMLFVVAGRGTLGEGAVPKHVFCLLALLSHCFCCMMLDFVFLGIMFCF